MEQQGSQCKVYAATPSPILGCDSTKAERFRDLRAKHNRWCKRIVRDAFLGQYQITLLFMLTLWS